MLRQNNDTKKRKTGAKVGREEQPGSKSYLWFFVFVTHLRFLNFSLRNVFHAFNRIYFTLWKIFCQKYLYVYVFIDISIVFWVVVS